MPWYTVEDDESPRKAGITLAKDIQEKFDLLVARKEAAPQFGLAKTTEGAKSGAISAASIVADIVAVDSWIYVLEIESSTWICCGREGYILPAGDRIYENRAEAQRAFQDLNPSSFKKVYLPASWKQARQEKDETADVASDIEETDVLDFIEYNPPKWGKMTSISPVGGILKAAIAVVLLGTVAFAGSAIYSNFTSVEPAPAIDPDEIARLRARLQEEQNQDRLGRWAKFDANRPWQRAPLSGEIVSNCLSQIQKMPTRPVGYEVSSIFCDGRNIDAAVERTTGYSTWLAEWSQSHPDIEATTNATGDQGYLSREISEPAPRGGQSLWDFQKISTEILRIGQIEGSRVDVTTPAANMIPEDPEYVPAYASSSYRISTQRPGAWVDFFHNTPGLTVKKINFTIKDQIYIMEGEIYVPNL
jgi:hypothetical protein